MVPVEVIDTEPVLEGGEYCMYHVYVTVLLYGLVTLSNTVCVQLVSAGVICPHVNIH